MSDRISPTAHYTGYVWYAHGLSHDAFATRTGRLMYAGLRGINAVAHAVGQPNLPGMLLARHRLIDLRLHQAIEAGELGQIVEVAAGLSPRGWRFRNRYGDRITYVEADLPDMIAKKRAIIAALGGETAHHRTAEIDALADSGPTSIDALLATLDSSRGTAIITEGLINYFSRDTVEHMWARFARALGRFPRGMYYSDLVVRETTRGLLFSGFERMLGAFVGGRIQVDFENGEDAERALERAGFDAVALDPRDFEFELPGLDRTSARIVKVIEALSKPNPA